MSIAELPTPVDLEGRTYSVDDLDRLPRFLWIDGRMTEINKYELIQGALEIGMPPGDPHGAMQLNIGTQLKLQGEFKGHGKARTEVNIVCEEDPDTVLVPDVVFIANKSLPLRKSKQDYLLTRPELVVEVRSRHDTVASLEQKAKLYLSFGVEEVWIVDRKRQIVTAFRLAEPPRVFHERDTLTLPKHIIPGFRLKVAEVFQE